MPESNCWLYAEDFKPETRLNDRAYARTHRSCAALCINTRRQITSRACDGERARRVFSTAKRNIVVVVVVISGNKKKNQRPAWEDDDRDERVCARKTALSVWSDMSMASERNGGGGQKGRDWKNNYVYILKTFSFSYNFYPEHYSRGFCATHSNLDVFSFRRMPNDLVMYNEISELATQSSLDRSSRYYDFFFSNRTIYN